VIEEVISDLDITKHVSEMPSHPPMDHEVLTAAVNGNFAPAFAPQYAKESEAGGTFTPAEAKAYVQQFAEQLRSWKRNRTDS
jgi:hypothetical protein